MPEDLVEPVVTTESPVPSTEAPGAAPLAEQLETATGGATPEAPAPTQTPSAEWQGVRDYARSQGIELPFADDGAALQALLQSHRQASERDYYSELGRRVAPHSSQWADYLRQRQQATRAPQAPPPWQGPEFDKAWLQLVERDETTGRLRSKAGYDPTIAEKVEAYASWREGFLESPEKVIAPLIEERARQLIEARFAEHGERSTADRLVAESAPWMFQADPQGAPVFTPQGQRQLTPEGVLYARAADSLWRGGLRDVRQIHGIARAQVENAVMRQRLLQGQPPAAPGASTLAAAPTLGAAALPSAAAPPAAPSQKGLSLRERLMVNLDRAGAPDNLNL